MLARAPGDVTRANAAQVNVPHRHDAHPIQPGATGQYAQLRRQRTRAAYSAQISQRRAAGMRCAAGQLTECRADCAADSAHIWSTRLASMVDLSARPRSVRRASRSQISQRSRKDRPHHGVDVARIEPWPPPAVPFGMAAPQAPVRAGISYWRARPDAAAIISARLARARLRSCPVQGRQGGPWRAAAARRAVAVARVGPSGQNRQRAPAA